MVCCRCDVKLEVGDEYKILFDEVYCIECAEDLEGSD